MEVLRNLFEGYPNLWGGGVAHSVLILSLTIAFGIILAKIKVRGVSCLLYTSDAADDLLCVALGGRRIINKKKKKNLGSIQELYKKKYTMINNTRSLGLGI